MLLSLDLTIISIFSTFTFFRVPDSFRDLWTREKKLQWKNVKQTFICSLHFESNNSVGKKLDFQNATLLSTSSTLMDIKPSEHDYVSSSSANENLQIQVGDLLQKNNQLEQECQRLKEENVKLQQQRYYLKRKSDKLANAVTDLRDKIADMTKKFDLSESSILTLNECASEVPRHLFEATVKRVRGQRDKSYHHALRKFALSLHLCSSKAYR